jgi:hypothetical protein
MFSFFLGSKTGSKQQFVVFPDDLTSVVQIPSFHQDAETKLRSSSDVPILRHATSTWEMRGVKYGKMESVP